MDTWPELPSKGSPKLTSSTLAPRETPPARSCTPKPYMDEETPLSAESSPTPRARPTYSEVLHPRPVRPIFPRNEPKAVHPLESPIPRPKLAPPKPCLPLLPVDQTRNPNPYEGNMPHTSRTTVTEPVPFNNVTALLASIRQDPQATFAYIQSLVRENDELKHEVHSMTKKLDFEREYLKTTVEDYEKLQSIGRSKQCILWTYIQRITTGGTGTNTSSVSEPATCIYDPQEESSMPQIEQGMDNMRLDPNAVCLPPPLLSH